MALTYQESEIRAKQLLEQTVDLDREMSDGDIRLGSMIYQNYIKLYQLCINATALEKVLHDISRVTVNLHEHAAGTEHLYMLARRHLNP